MKDFFDVCGFFWILFSPDYLANLDCLALCNFYFIEAGKELPSFKEDGKEFA